MVLVVEPSSPSVNREIANQLKAGTCVPSLFFWSQHQLNWLCTTIGTGIPTRERGIIRDDLASASGFQNLRRQILRHHH